jgi:hypothetical protein
MKITTGVKKILANCESDNPGTKTPRAEALALLDSLVQIYLGKQ